MKKTVFKYGIYALLSGFILFGLPFLFGMEVTNDYGELFGYTAIILSLVFVYFGIKHFRDQVNHGEISLGKALGLGMLIALFSALGVSIFDYFYTTQINPNFAQDYMEHSLSQMETSLSPEEFKIKSAELKQQMRDYGSPTFMALLMFVTVIILGFIISLISGLILQRKN